MWFVESTDRHHRRVPGLVVPCHRRDVVRVHEPRFVRDERRDAVVAPFGQGVVVGTAVREILEPPLVRRGVGVCWIETTKHFASLVVTTEKVFTERGEGGAR